MHVPEAFVHSIQPFVHAPDLRPVIPDAAPPVVRASVNRSSVAKTGASASRSMHSFERPPC